MTWIHATDYKARDNEPGLLNRGIWLHELPRPILACRIFGHRPVVDGFDSKFDNDRPRWVACGRCGTRPHPQGSLNAEHYELGSRYKGPHDGQISHAEERTRHPGHWPTRTTWDLSAQMLIGGAYSGSSAHFKVGNGGSENAISAHLHLGRLFALYLSTGELGRGIQRRLNPTGHESKVIELRTGDGLLIWKLWSNRDERSDDTPRWRDGSVRINPIDIVMGERRYSYKKVGDPVTTTLTMPAGDQHEITLHLEHATVGRKRGRQKPYSWMAEWDVHSGVPTKPHGGRVMASAVKVPAEAVHDQTWTAVALDAIAAQLQKSRDRYGYEGAEADR